MSNFVDLTLDRAAELPTDPETKKLIRSLQTRVNAVTTEQENFRAWCNRADALYYTTSFTSGGADLWPTDKSATSPGRVHVSVNLPAPYVDIPAALQGQVPIENMLATDNTDIARKAANAYERLYVAWKADQDFELTFNKATVIKALYGRTAGRVVWEEGRNGKRGKPRAEVIEQPRNLYMGYKSDKYDELEWAAYVLRYEPNALMEEFNVDVSASKLGEDTLVPTLGSLPIGMTFHGSEGNSSRDFLNFGDARVEVWDYWYRKAEWTGRGKNRKVNMVTCNVVLAGNAIIQGPDKYPEYNGRLPYVPLFNTFVPGMPTGRPELYDVEHLIRESYEKITAGGQMITNGVSGDYWQLVGPDAPLNVPADLKPTRNTIVGPGPGNRIETITPFIAEFQLEQYLGRIDRALAIISGLNDLLLGLAPAQVLSSSKAINALIANYEARLSMRRKLLYKWRRDMWELASEVWAAKDATFQKVIEAGAGRLDIIDPSLSPRDDMETATRASNLVMAKLWSQSRAMDAVGVDDPETEQDLIREESTDATLWPDRVMVMAQLMATLQSLNLNADSGTQQQAEGQLASGQGDLRAALGEQTPANSVGMQSEDTQGQTPPIEGAGPNAGGKGVPFAQAQNDPAQLQSMVQGGKLSGRLLSQTKLGRR